MKSKFKIIALTAIATTIMWAFLVAGFFWWAGKSPSSADRVHMEFLQEPGTLGTVEMRNPKTQAVLIAIEQLPTDAGITGRVQLARQQLSAGGSVRIGVREVSEDKK
ncbi:MAG: hypothetical protein EPO07_12060 [Verrucomicrobia bacterium]|nr:MAG: hypothetical protein EPO07_12060 [Verrucomicrobiota bacterium]